MGTTTHASAVAALGRRIHDLRAARGFTLLEFASLAGLTAPALSMLERGEETAPITTLFAVAEALEMPTADLLAQGPAAPVAVVRPVRTGADPAAPPAGYRPLEMPDLWDPDGPAAPAESPRAEAARTEAARTDAPRTETARADVPRTFADLRVGVLAERSFATLPEFAVAAVVEAGHPMSVIATIFRVPSWRLEAWVREGTAAPPSRPAPRRPR